MDAASSRFATCLPLLLREEGGFVNDPRDPGGRTDDGITQVEATAHHIADVAKITVAQAGAIYHSDYWDACSCDQLPAGVDRLVFDTAVNCGPSRARKWLQVAAGVMADGQIGKDTLAAVGRASPKMLVTLISARRKGLYLSSPDYDVFGKGWLNRLAEVSALAASEASPLPQPTGA